MLPLKTIKSVIANSYTVNSSLLRIFFFNLCFLWLFSPTCSLPIFLCCLKNVHVWFFFLKIIFRNILTMYLVCLQKSQRVFVPNKYIVPTDKQRKSLRWQIRMDLAQGQMPAHGFYHEYWSQLVPLEMTSWLYIFLFVFSISVEN